MKIKYFSQLCEQPHVNQFSHNFKVNEHIFHRLKLKLTVSHSIDKMNIFEVK